VGNLHSIFGHGNDLEPVELVTTCTLTMLGALEVVRAAYCAL